jgi:hypothetical protein
MSGAFCPACGVAVVPGYVRCPKCHKPLPQTRPVRDVGGTAVESTSRVPLVAILAGALVIGLLIAYFAFRSTKPEPKKPVAAPTQPQAPTQAAAAPQEVPQPQARPVAPAQPDPNAAAGDLERALRKQRLWSTVNVEGSRVDVRSGSCSDPAMAPALDASVASFKAAGLTQLRCLEQSGRVVSSRDL